MLNRRVDGQKKYGQFLVEIIRKTATKPTRIMEVCGTHTMAIAKSGIKQLLPDSITLLSGPGCPVCVTDEVDIDTACILAEIPGVILATYGDMLKVPGSRGSLESACLNGADIRVIYSSMDALQLAIENPAREVVLLSVGFETTTPTTAITIAEAIKQGIRNFSVLSLHKSVPPILKYLLSDQELSIDAFLLPGHVCVIAGTANFQFIAQDYARPCVVAGFDPIDILEAIEMLLLQQRRRQANIEIQYRAVQKLGNVDARRAVNTYFHLTDCNWRGMGLVPFSGYAIKNIYQELDAVCRFKLQIPTIQKNLCICGAILKGQKRPPECELFATACTPANPRGPCMVSEEGSCAAVYRFEFVTKG